MPSVRRRGWTCVIVLAGFGGWIGGVQLAFADGAMRDLSGFGGPSVTFTVTVAIDASPGTNSAGVEETPPDGWSVSQISDGGTWDDGQQEIKWGPFFEPSIPEQVTYDVTPPDVASGPQCFSGIAVFDTGSLPIAGDQCVAFSVPSISSWGLTIMTTLVMVSGTLIFNRRPDIGEQKTNRIP